MKAVGGGERTGMGAEAKKLWVFFRDKGPFTPATLEEALRRAQDGLTDKARECRAKVRRGRDIVDFSDLPVYEPYIRRIDAAGARHLTTSRWLNAISVQVSPEHVPSLSELPFVREIRPVVRYTRYEEKRPQQERPPDCILRRASQGVQGYDYGDSWYQIQQLKIDELHSGGYTGFGVRIGILDSGFEVAPNVAHRALRHLAGRIVAEHDFVNGDDYTGFDTNQDFLRQPEHGTEMLGLIAGLDQGHLVGPAFAAEFVLAKTEQVYDTMGLRIEIPQEEDYWVEGLEWCADQGAEIISSSLGYRDFDPGYPDYHNSDMDGHTAVTSVMASKAAREKGVLVVNAIGNAAAISVQDTLHLNIPDTTLMAPADAESILAVGGVDFDGRWARPYFVYEDTMGGKHVVARSYSARGPTSDGRTKPEVVAPWQAWSLSYPSTDSFAYLTGTSCATALTAGGCALLLEAHPDWGPMDVREALLNSGNFHDVPNDSMGWGLPDFLEAYQSAPSPVPPVTSDQLLPPYPNPFLPDRQEAVRLPLRLLNETEVTFYIFGLSGELVRTISLGRRMPGRYEATTGAYETPSWDGRNDGGKVVGSGVYICLLRTGFATSKQKIAVVR
jgi:hypothetical protein